MCRQHGREKHSVVEGFAHTAAPHHRKELVYHKLVICSLEGKMTRTA